LGDGMRFDPFDGQVRTFFNVLDKYADDLTPGSAKKYWTQVMSYRMGKESEIQEPDVDADATPLPPTLEPTTPIGDRRKDTAKRDASEAKSVPAPAPAEPPSEDDITNAEQPVNSNLKAEDKTEKKKQADSSKDSIGDKNSEATVEKGDERPAPDTKKQPEVSKKAVRHFSQEEAEQWLDKEKRALEENMKKAKVYEQKAYKAFKNGNPIKSKMLSDNQEDAEEAEDAEDAEDAEHDQ